MSTALTFTDEDLLSSLLVGADGAVHYTTSTTHGLLRRKVTTVTVGGGLVGLVDWRAKTFAIGGVQRKWHDLKTRVGGMFSSEREWRWADRAYKVKYNYRNTELLARSASGTVADTVRFTTYHPHLLRDSEHAAVHFPLDLRDATERMFLLLVILQTEIQQQDVPAAASAAG
ncbi:hypothetical protein DFH09DRAFT_1461588 [Mycena vulgaris]|nr:hypothetical protein DFH09DRAFT_1461588 [Mycena vulgaris]